MLKKLLIFPLCAVVCFLALFGFYLLYGRLSPILPILFAVFLLLPPTALTLAHTLKKGTKLRSRLHRFAEAVIGVYLYLLIVLLLLSVLCAVLYLTGSYVAPRFLLLIGALLLAAFLVPAILVARRPKTVTERFDLRSDKTAGGETHKVVLFSDLHLGFFTTKHLLSCLRDSVNRENPEAVLFAGDLFDSDYDELRLHSEALSALSGLHSRYGTFACPGNHDAYAENDPRQSEFFKNAKFTLLRDEEAALPFCTLLGRQDEDKERQTALTLLSGRKAPTVVLDHRPSDLPALADAGADLVLCGHTHGGQTFPGNLALRVMNRHSVGRSSCGKTQVYTTPGFGYWGVPLRLFTHNELTVLLLVCDK